MTYTRILSIALIFVCTSIAWLWLGAALSERTAESDEELSKTVAGNWGTEMKQLHPRAFYVAPTAARARRIIQPEASNVTVSLKSDPKKKGLLWYRTYTVDYSAEYLFKNPTPIAQTIYVSFDFPAKDARFDRFSLTLGETKTDKAPREGTITESVILEPGGEVPVRIVYSGTGLDRWSYSFGEVRRVRGFSLQMNTNFNEIDIPAGSESPTSRTPQKDKGWNLEWSYEDIIGANAIAMEMPAATNPGPIATRITYFAPISLLFFFAVLIIVGLIQGVNLHPVNYFLLAAGCFAFQLLFVYLVDLISVNLAFVISAVVSLLLVTGYLARAAGLKFARIAGVAQFAYMILFSYSFFFEGLTGITITVGAIVTLALLMAFTAKTDWATVLPEGGRNKLVKA